jgi:hypothetical protein
VRQTSLFLAAALLILGGRAARAQHMDQHYINADEEYFVADQEYNGGWQYVTLARMLRPASDTTKGEAQFMSLGGHKTAGQRFWSRWFWRTRLATPDDVKVGKIVVCLDAQDENGYRPPQNREETLGTSWWMGTVTDVTDMYKQQAMAGEFRVSINCLRVTAS